MTDSDHLHDHLGSRMSRLERFKNLDFEHLFELFGVKSWVKRARLGQDSAINIYEVAQNIGLPIEIIDDTHNPLSLVSGSIAGVTFEDDAKKQIVISLSSAMDDNQKSLTFGHELGHFFLYTQGTYQTELDDVTKSKEEDFCEAFGRQLVLPPEHLSFIDEVDQDIILALMNVYNTDAKTVIYQLMAAKKLPRTVHVDTGYGEVRGNPLLTGKIGRSVVCYDCAMHVDHKDFSDDAPVLDMTGVELLAYVGTTQHRQFYNDFSNTIELNKLYGRWTERDDVLLERKNRKDERQKSKQLTSGQEQENSDVIAQTDDKSAEFLFGLLDLLNFPNTLNIKKVSDTLIELLTSEGDLRDDSNVAWGAYTSMIETYCNKEHGTRYTDFQIGAIVHKATIFHVAGDTFRYLEVLQDAKDYTAKSNIDEISIAINAEINLVVGTSEMTPEIILIKVRPYISFDNYESLRESMLDHSDLEDLLGDIFGMLTEEGEDPAEILSRLKLTEEYLD
jgi:hypothetical protein